MTAINAEVWGSPIGHSRSPDLHLACYHHLGLPGAYARREVTESSLGSVFAQMAETVTGISLTMPLKTGILDLVPDHRDDVSLLQAANTAVKTDGHWWLTNTDPLGAAAMLRRLLPSANSHVVLLGAGATAKSVVMGLGHVSFTGHLSVVVRSVERSAGVSLLAKNLGMSVGVVEFGAVRELSPAALVISTLPSGTPLPEEVVDVLRGWEAPLVDVGYHPWPTPLAQAFHDHGVDAHSGLPMLMFQALAQIRAFVHGDYSVALPDEAGALVAMANAVGVDEVWATPALMGE
jgi:shikimate dehydrogenase